ncbi:hypothetical protein CSKR_113238 [Clonorchis sinensis]|uniref:Uncharacterized protein n=2 Tax=Clonorchis sinensis TaxID=79923 RepID=A0A8T1M8M9_CLOSI|nr:hypothetical protein CSKR_113238 [Clonorchis sinensis]GAA32891.1 hypothetical protein CLF_103152 [Clonorchis sinensis]
MEPVDRSRGKYAHRVLSARPLLGTLPNVTWFGCDAVPMEPLTKRNMKTDLRYSINKQKRWELLRELQQYLAEPHDDGVRVVGQEHRLFERYLLRCTVSVPELENVLTLNKNRNDLKGWTSNDKETPDIRRNCSRRMRRQHREHRRPQASSDHQTIEASAETRVSPYPQSFVLFSEPSLIKRSDLYRYDRRRHLEGVQLLKSKTRRELKAIYHTKDPQNLGDYFITEEELNDLKDWNESFGSQDSLNECLDGFNEEEAQSVLQDSFNNSSLSLGCTDQPDESSTDTEIETADWVIVSTEETEFPMTC